MKEFITEDFPVEKVLTMNSISILDTGLIRFLFQFMFQ